MSTVAKFSLVGLIGFCVQLAVLALLTYVFHWSWLPATIAAIECAIVHNFLWHERWTWKEKGGGLATFARFNVAAVGTSVIGNVLIMALLVRTLHVPVLPANAAAVALVSLANFMLADRWVFAVLLLLLSPAPAAAQPNPQTLAAWDKYVAATEARLAQADESRRASLPDKLIAAGDTIDVGAGTISHWRGAVFVRGVTVDQLLNRLQHPGTPPPQEDVVSSRVIARSPDHLRVAMRLVRHAIVTVSYDTEHEMTFERRAPTVATARSVATVVQEVGGSDHGFLWRLNSYWRYEAAGDGVTVSVESLTLSRDVPFLIKPIAGRIVPRIARESMVRTLEALKKYVETLG